MSSYISAGAKKLREAREWATPTLKESAFLVRGVLTPEEFVKAGDELVYKCPTWSWESGDRKKIKNYLPADKQVSGRSIIHPDFWPIRCPVCFKHRFEFFDEGSAQHLHTTPLPLPLLLHRLTSDAS